MAKIAIDAQTTEERLQRLELVTGIILDFMRKPEIVNLVNMPIEIENIINAYVGQLDKELADRDIENVN